MLTVGRPCQSCRISAADAAPAAAADAGRGAAMRQAVLAAVSDEDLNAGRRKVLEKTLQGDVEAARLLVEHHPGRRGQVVPVRLLLVLMRGAWEEDG